LENLLLFYFILFLSLISPYFLETKANIEKKHKVLLHIKLTKLCFSTTLAKGLDNTTWENVFATKKTKQMH
jgi:hypothetical protein